MAALNGKWKLASVDNFASYLDTIGVAEGDKERALKGLSAENNIVQEINIDGTSVNIKTTTPISSTETRATVGKEIGQKSMDGRGIKVIFAMDGDKLVETQTGAYTSTNTRVVAGSEMTMTMTSGDVTSTRKYIKQ